MAMSPVVIHRKSLRGGRCSDRCLKCPHAATLESGQNISSFGALTRAVKLAKLLAFVPRQSTFSPTFTIHEEVIWAELGSPKVAPAGEVD
jgi:hypothetical protein